MNIREELEQREHRILSPHASFSDCTRGRERADVPCEIRPAFQRDRDRILYSKSFRRLKDKTQVFLSPDGDHYHTRMTHTLEVAQNARTIARALRLNEDLIEAIALGHDLGHTPFGHAGERALNSVVPGGFRHNEQSLRIVERLEKDGRGLNLTFEVRDGILNHEMHLTPATLEGKVVRISDKVTYMHHDMDDAIRAGLLVMNDIPAGVARVLGGTIDAWFDTIIPSIVSHTEGSDDLRMDPEVYQAILDLRTFMFERVYTNPVAKGEEGKAVEMVQTLYDYYMRHTEVFPAHLKRLLEEGEPVERVTCDFISGMTDRYAVARYEEIFIPKNWNVY